MAPGALKCTVVAAAGWAKAPAAHLNPVAWHQRTGMMLIRTRAGDVADVNPPFLQAWTGT